MAQRISRAKQSIKASARAISDCRTAEERRNAWSLVLHVLYLIFNEGYTAVPDRTCSASNCRAKPSA